MFGVTRQGHRVKLIYADILNNGPKDGVPD